MAELYSFRLPSKHPLRRRVVFDQTGQISRTQQDRRDETDINALVLRYLKSGEKPPQMQFADLSSVPDFQTAQNAVIDAQNAFLELPARVRRFYNDSVQEFLGAVHDPKKVDELVSLGVLKKKVQEPPKVPEPKVPAPEEPSK